MKKKICIFILIVIAGLVFFAGLIVGSVKDVAWCSAICGLFVMPLFRQSYLKLQDLTDIQTWEVSLRKYLRGGVIKKSDYVRISFAYLFRIKVGDKYLLVFNHRKFGKYQPVGGVYKFSDNEKSYLKESFFVCDDDGIPVDKYSKNDYRLRVPVKYLKKFVERFDFTTDRERIDNIGREFKEELLEANILKRDNFKDIQYVVRGRYEGDLTYTKHFGIYELLLADIVELVPTKEQEEELSLLQLKYSTAYLWASEDDIKTCGVKKGSEKQKETITDHSFKILEDTALELITLPESGRKYDVSLYE